MKHLDFYNSARDIWSYKFYFKNADTNKNKIKFSSRISNKINEQIVISMSARAF
jgi:hypothetical protein